MNEEELRNAVGAQSSGAEGDDPELLRKLEDGPTLPSDLEHKYMRAGVDMLADDAPRTLDDGIRKRLEGMLGSGLRDVRLHTGEKAQRAADAMGARAFALGGRDIFFGRGAYQPGSREGIGLLAHEVAHTVEAAAPATGQIGFKSERGSGGGRGEQFADAAEGRVLAMEDSPTTAASQKAPAEEGGERGETEKPKYLQPEFVEREAWKQFVRVNRFQTERRGT